MRAVLVAAALLLVLAAAVLALGWVLSSRVVVCAVLQILVVTVSTYFAINHLTTHFKSQRLVA